MIKFSAKNRRIGWCAGVIFWVICSFQARAATGHWRALAQEAQQCAQHLADRREIRRVDPAEIKRSLSALLLNEGMFWEERPSREGPVHYRLAGDTALQWDQVISLARSLSAPSLRSHLLIHTFSLHPAQKGDLYHMALVVTGVAP